MKVFEISEKISLDQGKMQLRGRVLKTIKEGDELYLSSDKKDKARLLKIEFWGEPIDQIEPPHTCTLLLTTEDDFDPEVSGLFD